MARHQQNAALAAIDADQGPRAGKHGGRPKPPAPCIRTPPPLRYGFGSDKQMRERIAEIAAPTRATGLRRPQQGQETAMIVLAGLVIGAGLEDDRQTAGRQAAR